MQPVSYVSYAKMTLVISELCKDDLSYNADCGYCCIHKYLF